MKSHRRHMLRKLLHYAAAMGGLVAGGALLSLATGSVFQRQQANSLQPPPVNIDRQDALSQQLGFFTLGGLRSLVAEVLTLDATDAWSKHDWPRVMRRWESATTLAPRRINYWINAAYDMTDNAAGHIAADSTRTRADRLAATREYINRGEKFLLQGIANNPDNWRLHLALAEQYGNIFRRPQFSKASAAMAKALQLGAPSHYRRFLFYNLCRTRGGEQAAWKLGRELWQSPDNRVPALRFLLFVLQHKIEVPAHEALSVEELYCERPDETEQEILHYACKEMRLFLNNDMLYPVNGVQEFLKQQAPQQ